MTPLPDFFLTSKGEGEEFSIPCACRFIARKRDNVRDDYMLVEIHPHAKSKKSGNEFSHLLLAARHSGVTLFPISEWPTFVYVNGVLDASVVTKDEFKLSQIEMICWGAIFPTLEAAQSG
jgi:hypothetical protein